MKIIDRFFFLDVKGKQNKKLRKHLGIYVLREKEIWIKK